MRRFAATLLALVLTFSPVLAQNGLPGGPGAQIPNSGGGSGAPTGAAGGSLGGTYPNPTVVTNANQTGDCTSVGNATTCLKTNGVVFGPAAAALVGQIPGTATNDAAAAGNVGEFVVSAIVAGSAVPLTTTVSANVTSIPLTAGDWDVWVNGVLTGGASTTLTYAIMSVSTISGTLCGTSGACQNTAIGYNLTPFTFANNFVVNVGPTRVTLAVPTTIYLVANSAFGVSTASAYGQISARRRR